jgi:hypothetical protein
MTRRERLEKEEREIDHNYRVMKDYYRRERSRTVEGMAWQKLRNRASVVTEWAMYAVLLWAVVYAIAELIHQ